MIGLVPTLISIRTQGGETRKTQRVERRITSIREASDLVYRRGPAATLAIFNAWELVGSKLSEVESQPFWPYAPGEAILPEMPKEKSVKAALDSAYAPLTEGADLLAQMEMQGALIATLFDGGGPTRSLTDVPIELTWNLQQERDLVQGPRLLPMPKGNLKPTPPVAARGGGPPEIPEELKERFRVASRNLREVTLHQLQSSKDGLEAEDAILKKLLIWLHGRIKFAIEHLDQ
jgi:hypothetical protein